MKTKFVLLITAVALSLTACMVGGKYSPKEMTQVSSSTQFPQDSLPVDSLPLISWWEVYRDTVLQRFINTTLANNRNLMEAAMRIEEAREIAGIVKVNLWPSFGYQASAGGGEAGSEALKVSGGFDQGVIKTYATMNWEIDLWGRLRHANEATYQAYLAETEYRNGLVVSLVGETAQLYLLLRDLDNRLAIAERTLLSRRESTRIITDRFNQGYVSEIDKLQAEQQEYIVEASIQSLRRQIVITQNALKVLMGEAPGQLPRGESLYAQNLPEIPPGLPSELLLRRPDVRAAEREVESQFNRIGIAKANLYPSISLTGLLGFASPQLSTLISDGGFVANGFAGIVGPIFEFQKNRRRVKAEEYRTEQLVYRYEQTVLEALSEVDNALVEYRTYGEEHRVRALQMEAARKALELTRAKYDYGYTSYYEVLIQENYLFEAELEESFTKQRQLTAITNLYKSLGGGW